jgi:hypothetical protein
MKIIARSVNSSAAGLAGWFSWNRRWMWIALVVFCSMADAMPPPRPNLITGFHIGPGDGLLVSTSYHRYFRGSPTGSVWDPTTPEAMPVLNMPFDEVHPIIVGQSEYVCDRAGVFKTTNGVRIALGSLPGTGWCRSLVYFGANLYAATGDALYLSHDLGMHWTRLAGLPGSAIERLFSGPTHGVYASAVTHEGSNNVAYRYDPERGWSMIDFGAPRLSRKDPDVAWRSARDYQPELIAMIDDILYASSLAGLMRSVDGGQRWELFQAGLPDPLDARNITPIDVVSVMRQNAAGVLYAATRRGIYRYVQREQRWEPIPLAGTRIGEAFFGK